MSDDLHKDLAGVRADIDRIDGDLLRLLNERARCAQRVGEIRRQSLAPLNRKILVQDLLMPWLAL